MQDLDLSGDVEEGLNRSRAAFGAVHLRDDVLGRSLVELDREVLDLGLERGQASAESIPLSGRELGFDSPFGQKGLEVDAMLEETSASCEVVNHLAKLGRGVGSVSKVERAEEGDAFLDERRFVPDE